MQKKTNHIPAKGVAVTPLSRRLFVESSFIALSSLAMAACGGGGGGAAEASPATVALTPTSPSPPPPSPPPPAPPVGTVITSLRLQASATGTVPYSATVLPLQGQVPAGSTLASPDDGGLRAAVLSRWNDGSAAVMVVASSTSVTAGEDRIVRLQSAAVAAGETNLSVARVAQLVSVVAVDCGTLGRAEIRDFTSPERVWWASPQTICARYRVAVSGHATLEALIDVHAYASDRALVEVVLENGKMLTSAPVKPAAASYTGATVSVNGTVVSIVNSADMPAEATHSAFRAWYARSWVGGDPNLRATQSHADLQKHPLLFKCDQAPTSAMAGYAADTYTPWAPGRQRATGMGSGGDHASIGPLPLWEAHFLQTGDYRAARAVEASALACLGYNINYRDSQTGTPPTFAQLKVTNRSQNGYSAGAAEYWPSQGNSRDAMTWEVAHHPAAGLMAFITRPSPVFIELAQKIAVWNGTWSVVSGAGPVYTTGVFGRFFQMRGRAWCLRSLSHATFLTPDAHDWKAPAKVSISDNVVHLDQWRTDSKALLNAMWDARPDTVEGYPIGARAGESTAAQGSAMWMYHYLIVELHKVASAQLLSGTAQTALTTLADWCALQPVRWINEQNNGGWRYIPYATPLGRDASTLSSLSTWGAQMDWWHDDAPPTVSGTWFSTSDFPHSYAAYFADTDTVASAAYYPWYFWSALVAAVERGVPGSATAWATVQSSITNLTAWRAGFGKDPRWGSTPRNL